MTDTIWNTGISTFYVDTLLANFRVTCGLQRLVQDGFCHL
jgi:hypothetical protein